MTGNPESDIQTLPVPRGTLRRIALHSDCQAADLGGMFIFAPVPSRVPPPVTIMGVGRVWTRQDGAITPPAAC